jgi:predicted alpha/beta superfamily hydrolase
MKLKLLIAFTIISRLAFSQINLEKEVVSREFIIHELNSKSFKEKRVVKTFLPSGYDRKKKYPVIYVLDGDPVIY